MIEDNDGQRRGSADCRWRDAQQKRRCRWSRRGLATLASCFTLVAVGVLALAWELGADVPFFLAPEPSLVRGIGEQISPLKGLPGSWLVLANPGVSLATAEVFEIFDSREPALTLDRSRYTMRSLDGLGTDPRAAESLSQAFDSGLLENDLEAAATELCPAIGVLQEQLGELGARWTGMSGSGATVYGVFADEEQARLALERARFEAPIWACVAQTQGGSKAQRSI